jgi:hypothetical protein
MLTEDRARFLFHARAEEVLADVEAPADLLGEVNRQVRRQRRRRAAVVVPVVAVVLTAGAVTAVSTWTGAETVDVRPSNPPATWIAPAPRTNNLGPTVRLFDYKFVLPKGFRVTDRSGAIDLGDAHPAQPVAGRTAFFSAKSGPRSLDVAVYRGAIAAAEAGLQQPRPQQVVHTTIAGYPATVDPFGTSRTCRPAGQTSQGSPGTSDCTGRLGAPAGSGLYETRVRPSVRELILVESSGVARHAVIGVLAAALRHAR